MSSHSSAAPVLILRVRTSSPAERIKDGFRGNGRRAEPRSATGKSHLKTQNSAPSPKASRYHSSIAPDF